MGNKISRKTDENNCRTSDMDQKAEAKMGNTISQQSDQPKRPPLQLASEPATEKVIEAIIEANDSNVLLNVLKSENLTFSEKTGVMWGLHYCFDRTKLTWRDMFWIEDQLEEGGHLNVVQYLRFIHYNVSSLETYWETESMEKAIEGDIKTRWLIQREICVNQHKQSLQQQLDSPPPYHSTRQSSQAEPSSKSEVTQQLDSCNQELKNLNKLYWEHQNTLHQILSKWGNGAARQAYDLLRKTDDWYLNKWHVQDCKGRKGCCSRPYGCCERNRETERHEKRGHCTSACPCCVKLKIYQEILK
ncbi:hypothetical protein N7493_009580 [Penicillium malachiteum]|uniref:Uncharacterized protein n=1 Tax=Penicillium malachiteum TaxID=1324776 RepID=A0AAD6MSH9_9EURO|nr:hypothetical protein N7493_009580 [Penicillium malachiteum]